MGGCYISSSNYCYGYSDWSSPEWSSDSSYYIFLLFLLYCFLVFFFFLYLFLIGVNIINIFIIFSILLFVILYLLKFFIINACNVDIIRLNILQHLLSLVAKFYSYIGFCYFPVLMHFCITLGVIVSIFQWVVVTIFPMRKL